MASTHQDAAKSPYLQALVMPEQYKPHQKGTSPLPSLEPKVNDRPESPPKKRPSSVDFKENALNKLRYMLKDRDSCITKLKAEMMLLKQVRLILTPPNS